MIGEKLSASDTHSALKDGIALVKLANKFYPGTKFNNSKMPFLQMESINNFLKIAAEKLKVPSFELFQTIDLYEKKDLVKVIDTIYAVSRHASAQKVWTGPTLGPKLADQRSVDFSEEQINQGKTFVSLQYGYNQGASQAGMSFGGRREISDAKGGDSKSDNSIPSLQSGYAGGSNQSGMQFGGRREIGGSDPSKLARQIQDR